MTKTPINLQELRRRIYQKAKAEPTHRFWGLFVDTLLTREYEIELYQYYNRQGYWVEEPAPKKHSL